LLRPITTDEEEPHNNKVIKPPLFENKGKLKIPQKLFAESRAHK